MSKGTIDKAVKAVLEGLDKDSHSQQREESNCILHPGEMTYGPDL